MDFLMLYIYLSIGVLAQSLLHLQDLGSHPVQTHRADLAKVSWTKKGSVDPDTAVSMAHGEHARKALVDEAIYIWAGTKRGAAEAESRPTAAHSRPWLQVSDRKEVGVGAIEPTDGQAGKGMDTQARQGRVVHATF